MTGPLVAQIISFSIVCLSSPFAYKPILKMLKMASTDRSGNAERKNSAELAKPKPSVGNHAKADSQAAKLRRRRTPRPPG